MKYYTGTGDTGKTQVKCEMVQKDDQRVEAIGDIDELNSFVGLARTSIKNEKIDSVLKQVQSVLFTAGSEVGFAATEVKTNDVRFLEETIDNYAKQIEELKYFIYPSGSQAAAILHICRTVCRRAERSLFKLSKQENVSKELLCYVNRLSSLFFVLARVANKEANVKDEVWKI